MENVVAFEIARAFRDKFSGDSMVEVQAQYDAFLDLARRLPLDSPDGVRPDDGEDQTED